MIHPAFIIATITRHYSMERGRDVARYARNKASILARQHRYNVTEQARSVRRRRLGNVPRVQYLESLSASVPQRKPKKLLRKRLHLFIRSNRKSTHTIFGCSPQFLREHLESQFVSGMSWDTYGVTGWHIDHIVPCSKFNLTIRSQAEACFHFSNLRPLDHRANASKGNRILSPVQPQLLLRNNA